MKYRIPKSAFQISDNEPDVSFVDIVTSAFSLRLQHVFLAVFIDDFNYFINCLFL